MKLSKRDFLKTLGLSAAAVPALSATGNLGAQPLVKEPALTAAPAPRTLPETALRYEQYDAIDDILYDRIVFPAGASLPRFIRFFNAPIGTQCPYTGVIKTHSFTNMNGSGALPAPENFWARRIHVGVDPTATAADVKIARGFHWTPWLAQKRFAGGPFAIDMQRKPLIELLRRKTPGTRASLEFETGKGLFIPQWLYFAGEVAAQDYKRFEDYHQELESVKLSPNGNGLELIFCLEGVRWRGIC